MFGVFRQRTQDFEVPVKRSSCRISRRTVNSALVVDALLPDLGYPTRKSVLTRKGRHFKYYNYPQIDRSRARSNNAGRSEY